MRKITTKESNEIKRVLDILREKNIGVNACSIIGGSIVLDLADENKMKFKVSIHKLNIELRAVEVSYDEKREVMISRATDNYNGRYKSVAKLVNIKNGVWYSQTGHNFTIRIPKNLK
jgi:hypothetical protein